MKIVKLSALLLSVYAAQSFAGLSSVAARGHASSAQGASDTVVVLDNNMLGRYNPISGHGRNGDSHVYQGLYRIEPGVFDRQPKLLPLLASGPAIASNGNRLWTVPLRSGVTFSDGSSFGPEDVVATYRAFIDPRSASTQIAHWDNIEKIEAENSQVKFTLKEPFNQFDRRLLNAIAPSEAFDFDHLQKATDSSLNTHPVGTGPYVLSELRSDQAIFIAREDYWRKKPLVKKLVIRHTEDDNARAQQIRAGEGDGTILPEDLAETFGAPDYEVLSVKTLDWRGMTLPAGHPVTGDDAMRLAVNYAVNRDYMVKYVLKGHATANSLFVTGAYGDAYDPSLEFPYDPDKAKAILDQAGWIVGSDGVRVKNGQRAAFDVIYFPNRDSARRDLSLAVASDLKKIGIEVTPISRNSKSVTREDYAHVSVMLGGGGEPYSLDGQVYHILHSKYAEFGSGAKWDNGSDYSNPSVDKLLDDARSESDATKQAALYRSVAKEYRSKPAMLQLVYMNHVYVQRNQGYKNVIPILEPHAHGVNFGPWYEIESWQR